MTMDGRGARAPAANDIFTQATDHFSRRETLQGVLAEIDAAYEGDVETVRRSDTPEIVKQEVLETLKQRHRERRALYIRRLQSLARRVVAVR